jgi:hypothetical protein
MMMGIENKTGLPIPKTHPSVYSFSFLTTAGRRRRRRDTCYEMHFERH